MNFLDRISSFFAKSTAEGSSSSTHFKTLLERAQRAEKNGDFEKAILIYTDASIELETNLRHKREEKYYRSKFSEIRFNIDKLKNRIAESDVEIIKFPTDKD
jgi:hypothetical protein